MVVKVPVILLLFIVVIFLGYWFDSRGQLDILAATQRQESTLISSISNKHQQVVNLVAYRQQLQQVKTIFKKLLRHLPTRSEVPGLLEDISKTGTANGLEFKLFKPLPEIRTEFYAELPIKISVIGNYHQLAQYISAIAGFDRIVTLHDFTIKSATLASNATAVEKRQATDNLILDMTAKTYRYTGGVKEKQA